MAIGKDRAADRARKISEGSVEAEGGRPTPGSPVEPVSAGNPTESAGGLGGASGVADFEVLAARLRPRRDGLPAPIRSSARVTPAAIAERWGLLQGSDADRAALCDGSTLAHAGAYARNIENLIGEVRTPVGIAGPLRVNGLAARADYFVPLATTEAALVASYSRGMGVITEAGGCAAWVVNEGVMRAPGFVFATTADAGLFVAWVLAQLDRFRTIVANATGHGRLVDVRVSIEGNHAFLGFEFSTGDASGQNIVTLTTEAIVEWILANTPVVPRRAYLEANVSGDKKASVQSYLTVRGRKVIAEVTIDGALVHQRLGATAREMADYWHTSAMGAIMSGMLGVHGQIANGLAAIYLACGQDIACVAEAAVGITRMEATDGGALYAVVTLPNIIVGTVGGGTATPTARACLNILGLSGAGKSDAFAEVCAGSVLAGELSIVAALAAGHFARGHRKRARGKGADATEAAETDASSDGHRPKKEQRPR